MALLRFIFAMRVTLAQALLCWRRCYGVRYAARDPEHAQHAINQQAYVVAAALA